MPSKAKVSVISEEVGSGANIRHRLITMLRLDEQEFQIGKGPLLARTKSPTDVHHALRQSTDRLLTPYRNRLPLSCKMGQRDGEGSLGSAPDQYRGRQRGHIHPPCLRC